MGSALAFAALAAAFLAEAMYRLSPVMGAAVLVAPAVAGLVVWRPTLGIYGGLLAVPFEASGASVGSSNVTPAKAIFVLTAASILPRLVIRPSTRRLHPAHLWLIALLAVSISGLAFAPDTHAVLVISGNGLAYLMISIYVSRMERAEIDRLLGVFIFSGALIGALTILSSGGQGAAATSDAARAQLGFDSPNVLAFYLLLTLGPALAALAESSGWRQRLLATGAAPLIVVALVLTQSRSAILGGGMAILVLLASSRLRRIAGAIALVLFVVVALNFGAIERSPQLSAVQQRLAAIDSLSGVQQDPRILIWRTTPQIIADHPVLGVGEGNFPAVSAGYGLLAFDLTPIDHAHDIFLTVAAELGMVGLAVFFGFLLALVRAAWRALTRARSSRGPILGLAAALTGLLFTSLGDYPPRAPTVLATLLIMTGMVLALEREACDQGPQPQPTPRES